jgi:hypothetical protein
MNALIVGFVTGAATVFALRASRPTGGADKRRRTIPRMLLIRQEAAISLGMSLRTFKRYVGLMFGSSRLVSFG